MADAKTQGRVVSAARFRLEVPMWGTIALSEISNINSKVGSTEYIYNDDKGKTIHSRQFGKTEPPTVTVKRGLDLEGNDVLLRWHAAARDGLSEALAPSASLVISDASGSADSEIIYLLEDAWCSELMISPMKAGDGQVTYLEAKITCSKILSPTVQMKSA
ncbi:virus tail tube protein gp19 [Actinokineospora alba]|uniref:Virus tail tube protein gp19 n=1 Tax=Actinokineospora alba TaxID=504798 RepID=A0A1H0F6C6_9PSEU|nr:phage tail protein [Actinokineospora alba]TDP69357.1 tail tube protein gp19 [Actinokineospora alba]SDI18530.1 virus tail tube protein gp19 [Actinokineospora alba]SDN90166.1 virus tail tube protein gp19 [Actinokineospora alba]